MTRRRRLRVALLISSLDLGGSERQLSELALRLPQDRFEVDFVLLQRSGSLAEAVEAAGVRVRVLSIPTRRTSSARWALAVPRVASTLRSGRYDIVDAWLFHAYVIAALARPLAHFPVFIAGRRSLSDFKAHFGPAYRFLDATARRSADVIVANSFAVRDDVIAREHIEPIRLRVIRNGVKIPPPVSIAERGALRGAMGYEPHEYVVGCVANYKPGKGLESLLRVASRLRQVLPNFRLALVGEGPNRGVLELMVQNLAVAGIVRLHGCEPDARHLYGAFDVIVSASESEGLPNVLLEASAAGRAIVATAAGGSDEVVVDGETGLLVPVGDESGLESALIRIAREPALRERLGASAARRAANVFGMDRFVMETADLYEEYAERKRGR